MARSTLRVLNDMIARQAVARSYTEFYETHAELEQLAVSRGDFAVAEQHHHAALALLWAIDNEARNPKPDGLA